MKCSISRAVALAALLLLAPVAYAGGTAETAKLRVRFGTAETVAAGSTYEIIINYENLTDRAIRLRSSFCMQTPFGMLCTDAPAVRKLEARLGVQIAVLFICEASTPPGVYPVVLVVESGKDKLTIPHTITVVEGQP